jgi:hypothetical protein
LSGSGDQFADELAGVGVDDADVQILDQEQDAGARPMPMWWSFPLWWREMSPVASMRSVRTRSWVSAERSPGPALGLAA